MREFVYVLDCDGKPLATFGSLQKAEAFSARFEASHADYHHRDPTQRKYLFITRKQGD